MSDSFMVDAAEPMPLATLMSGDTVGEAAALAAVFNALHTPSRGEVTEAINDAVGTPFVVLPKDKRIESLRPLLDARPMAPVAHAGVTELYSQESFTDHVESFKAPPHSVIYCSGQYPQEPVLQCVYDHAAQSVPSFERWRAKWVLRYSDEFKVWSARSGQWQKQAEFARFLESRALELADASNDPVLTSLAERLETTIGRPADMLRFARQMQVRVDSVVHEAITTATGEVSVTYQEKHDASHAGAALKVPTLFAILVPVFYRGNAYNVPARLAYRLNAQRVEWMYELYRPDAIVTHIVNEVLETVREETELPVLLGTPRVG